MEAVSGNNNVAGLGGHASYGTVLAYWDRTSTRQDNSNVGAGISSITNVYMFTNTNETGGREQGKFYDAATGDTEARDSNDLEIFNNEAFLNVFDIPAEDAK